MRVSSTADRRRIKRRFIDAALWLAASVPPVAGVTGAHAQTTDLGTVQTSDSASDVNSAVYQAPTTTPLTVTQPTSVIDKHYIENNIPQTANFDKVISVAPSVMVQPSGKGGDDATISIRGFQNGQFNVTLDGIPMRSYSQTNRSGTFIMTNDLGQVSVDRGPGTASNVGDATFGGTVALQTKSPMSTSAITATTSYGSFNTQLYGLQLDSGKIASTNGASLFLDTQFTKSDGYYTNTAKERENAALKFVQPLSDNTTLTFVSIYNNETRNYFSGASLAQIAAYGPNYGLSSSPNQQNYAGYNFWNIKTDFDYLGLQSDFGDGWHLENKVYTYGYYQAPYLVGADVSGNSGLGTVLGVNDVPGNSGPVNYRSYGDVIAIAKELPDGAVKMGAWAEHQPSYRGWFNVDMTLAQKYISTNFSQNLALDTVQPYVEGDWKPLPGLTITTGAKYAYVKRSYDSLVDPNTHGPLDYSQTWAKALPSLAANYKLSPNWSVYAQAAEGFLTPPAALPGSANVQPQTTWNYQVGTSYQSQSFTLAGDVYYIDFQNMIASRSIGGVTNYFNQGGVTYKGIELEGTVHVGNGFSVFGNGSLNSAKSVQTGQWIAQAPNATLAAGLIYEQGNWHASLTDKWVGSRFGDVGQKQPLSPFNQLDMAVTYKVKNPLPNLAAVTAKFGISNILDSRTIVDFGGYSGKLLTPLFYTQIGRNIYSSLTVQF
ncbi:iron complex outermembrane receptor protein [Bradyrhizobium macuxiense]|uniref:Iron complex outermembrane receptor protein n=1 Tax=Bradyrhizobium macuxiense TaxID=1755647 RepID=A0A560KVJ4_9BRAD|nr:TonB-dependent receptor [Bradyrhizobium macuxiense]TWB87253.1 iron complex outermembrane receptor protein [Bradyrhizobium macuxiense]